MKYSILNTHNIMMDWKKIKEHLSSGKTVEDIVEMFGMDWKEFEDLVAEIFRNHEFAVKQNFRYKTDKRHEIDLLAIGHRFIFCVDCKEWGRGRNKKSGIERAVELQENRTNELKKFLKSNIIAKSMMKINLKRQKMHSLIVTWLQEDIVQKNKVYVVPIWKLNTFLQDVDSYYFI